MVLMIHICGNTLLPIWEEAVRLLPEKQEEIGRINKNAARAMAAKALLFMAYKQDARHQVVEVDKKILERALVYINEITDQEGGNVGLCEDFAENSCRNMIMLPKKQFGKSSILSTTEHQAEEIQTMVQN